MRTKTLLLTAALCAAGIATSKAQVYSVNAVGYVNTALVKAFVSAIGFLPKGSLVRTNKGELGVVIRTNPADPLHPILAPVDEGLNRLGGEIDTSARDNSGAYERTIVETLPLDGRSIDLERLAS